MEYQKLEEAVYNYLTKLTEKEGDYFFSVRKKANKGSELDYFIGTKESNYSLFSLWNIKSATGSPTDVIDYVFTYHNDNFYVSFQYVCSRKPLNEQEKACLKLGELLETKFSKLKGDVTTNKSGNSQFTFNFRLSSNSANNLEDFLSKLKALIDATKEIVNQSIIEIKTSSPTFVASQITNSEFEELIKRLKRRINKYSNQEPITTLKSTMNQYFPLNQIFYGPPGTGKTYSTIDKVVQICEPEEYSKGEHEMNKVVYDRLVNDGRVFFTTFHQSMAYEDFIEGIKPIAPKRDTDPVQYKIEDGIFKLLCEQSLDEIRELKNQQYLITPELSFKEKYAEFVRQIQAGIINLETRSGLPVSISKVSPSGNMRLITGDDTKDYIVSANRLERLLQEIPKPDKVTNIHEAVRNAIGGSHSSLYFASLMAFKEFDKKYSKTIAEEGKQIDLADIRLTTEEIQSLPKYVIVIDEINRGNVSAIFGELITLIEEDKRFSYDNQLTLKLPYSKSEFVVPPNLYIIGTMNTADRSVEALDTALRRRFSFTEMLPKPNLIKTAGPLKATNGILEGIDLALLLTTINKRIEKLLDKDHQIGHSYFLKVDSLDRLKSAFHNAIIPLLQEYFFGDYGKIGLVIGQGFFEVLESSEDEKFFAEFKDYEIDGILDKGVYHIKDVTQLDDPSFIEIVQAILPRS